MAPGFFPLDEELALLPGGLTPHVYECLVRLGTWIPSFDQARKLLVALTGTHVSEATTRRKTEAAGAAYVSWQTEEAERLERTAPPAPTGPAKALLSVDGVFVPLRHGEWAEVKTLALGEIQTPVLEKDEWVVHTNQLSYFSRLIDSDTFCRLAVVETQRRGLDNAQQVAAVNDGAEWEQTFIDYHREDAVRILDFPHVAERLSQCGAALFGDGTPESHDWLSQQLHDLKHEGPGRMLAALSELGRQHPDISVLSDHLAYLQKREPHMQYPAYQTQGLPIGSGAVESSHKQVVEARLKGPGMHWQRAHVNPMLALRNMACNDRWEEDWPQIATRLRQDEAQRRSSRRAQRRLQAVQPTAEMLAPLASPTPLQPASPSIPPPALSAESATPPPAKKQPYRPGPDHPWRHSPIGRARYRTNRRPQPEKT